MSALDSLERSALIFPDTIEAGPEPTPWLHGLKNRFRRFGYDAHPKLSPDAKADTWVEWLEQQREAAGQYADFYFAREDATLAGHGLGAAAVLRVVEQLSQPIDRVLLFGTPIGIGEISHGVKIKKFTDGFDFDWEKIRWGARGFHLFHATNDPNVPLDNSTTVLDHLAASKAPLKASLVVAQEGEHFNDPVSIPTVMRLSTVALRQIDEQRRIELTA